MGHRFEWLSSRLAPKPFEELDCLRAQLASLGHPKYKSLTGSNQTLQRVNSRQPPFPSSPATSSAPSTSQSHLTSSPLPFTQGNYIAPDKDENENEPPEEKRDPRTRYLGVVEIHSSSEDENEGNRLALLKHPRYKLSSGSGQTLHRVHTHRPLFPSSPVTSSAPSTSQSQTLSSPLPFTRDNPFIVLDEDESEPPKKRRRTGFLGVVEIYSSSEDEDEGKGKGKCKVKYY